MDAEHKKEDRMTNSDGETSTSKSSTQGPLPNASRTALGLSNPEEVSEEHKESIIAGRIRFPAFSGVERSDSGSGGLPPGAIPMPVPIFDGSKLVVPNQASRRVLRLPTPKPSASSSFWSFLGFGSSEPSTPPVAADRRVVVGPPAPHSPAHVPSQPANYIRPPPPFRSQPQQGVTSKPRPVYNPRPQPFYTRADRPAPATTPRPVPAANPPPVSRPGSATRPNPPAFVVPSARPEATPRPFRQSPPSTEPRPVYRHTSTAPPPTASTTTTTTTTTTSTTTTTTPRPTTTRSPTSPSPPTTSQPVTPMRITEYNPYYAHAPQYDENRGGFKPPTIQSSSYDGWRVVGVPSTPLEGQGDSLSPVVSFVKENTPEIIIRAPTRESSDDDVVTGVISDRMGEVADEDQLVQFSSRLNVETPGIVQSYWVKAPSLA
ncbi:pollen-specific leucine-rich repeat extensin-like protein 2 [Penaeus monodon]|uniref:pollen-specific leucine-rich repeat extensin-like protein 2 n=1 Tax=Penaeus monodon TaxID=6687 RepID=UPI0018A7A4C1|nr:pollen-specific leucine-rich repeat extensin-like protein 2 [Penaeus monodon]